jgi:2-methylisocitrate lyase-like PEP mutase family enzyme
VVPDDEAYARIQAAVDARDEGQDIWILGRTDSLIHGYDEAVKRARRFIEIGVDAVFVEAVPDRATMERLIHDLDAPCMANIIPGGRTEEVPATELARIGYSAVAYPFALLSATIKGVRGALEDLKSCLKTGKTLDTMPAQEIMDAVGFTQYYKEEEKYQYGGRPNGTNGFQWE